MTPISFALEIILDCTTIEEAHKRARKYIKELEKGQASPRVSIQRTTEQAPSTQRLLEAQLQTSAPLVAPPTAQRIVGGEVSTGNGTKGPRKW